MFEDLDDAAVLDELAAAARHENIACARRFAAIGEIYARRAPEEDVERLCWAVDGHANVVAEISAALSISRGRAAGQLRYAIALRDELPNVAEVFGTGAFDFRVMAALVNRTALVDDPERMARVDAELARRAAKWTRLSGPKLDERIDMVITSIDPDGIRVPNKTIEDRHIDIAPTNPGMAGIWANIESPDAAALDKALDGLAATVCPNDPRTSKQRRADAVGALAGYRRSLPCRCGSDDCPARGADRPVSNVVIHVLAEQATLNGTSQSPGYVPGYGALPAGQVRDLAATAKVKPVIIPPAAAEAGYRPSAALAEFIRLRDLTCRFPGCDQPAEVCQIDHTIPHPVGPTHPSNLKLYCPHHHMIKTFYVGDGGWTDRQLPDGTVRFTAPSGQTYTTRPGGALFFPVLGTPTGTIEVPRTAGPHRPGRETMMPRRKQTRSQGRAARIAAERRINHERNTAQAREQQDGLAANHAPAANDEPPPF
ncbi:MAG: HNH endonuclease [Actinobacteria bacterium]|nr:HNH endonuclease [Actinomycetota bacterium]